MFKWLQPDQPSVNDLALKHMEEKYGEPFTYCSPWGSSYNGAREFLVTCESLPGKTVLVRVENFRSDSPVYRDNFLAVKFAEQVVDFFRGKAEEAFGQVNVFYETSKFSLTGDDVGEATFEGFYTDPGTVMDVLVEIRGSVTRQQVEALAASLGESRARITLTLVAVTEDTFGTRTRQELNQLAYRGEAVFTAAIRSRDGSFIIDWQED